jgi:hypothetical protein
MYLKEVLPPGSVEGAKWTALLHPRLSHGGPSMRGKRKTSRPYFSNTPQVFLLSSKRASGIWDLAHRRHRSRITSQIYTYAKRFRVRVYSASIQKGQIQLLVKSADRKDLADFFRVLAGRVAISVTGARKKVRRIGKFWDELCFSRMLNWGREFHHFRQMILSSRSAIPPSHASPSDETNSSYLRGS